MQRKLEYIQIYFELNCLVILQACNLLLRFQEISSIYGAYSHFLVFFHFCGNDSRINHSINLHIELFDYCICNLLLGSHEISSFYRVYIHSYFFPFSVTCRMVVLILF